MTNCIAEKTLCKRLRHLKAALHWAKSMGMLHQVPVFHFPKFGRHQSMMKGRPISDEEFQRMLDAVESVVGIDAAPSWKYLMEGLWWSGLRLGEALCLTWHPSHTLFVRFDCKYPMLCINASAEKGRRDRLLPMAPEFAGFLKCSQIKRHGFVFAPLGALGDGNCRNVNWVSKIGSRIGVRANVITKLTDGPKSKARFATFHDLRRSFGSRWSKKVMPQALMQLMRHESIDTTLRYYVESDANRLAEQLYEGLA